MDNTQTKTYQLTLNEDEAKVLMCYIQNSMFPLDKEPEHIEKIRKKIFIELYRAGLRT